MIRISQASVAALVLLGFAAALLTALIVLAPLRQDPLYHQFADQRTLFGVPHFWNVITNLPFLLTGIAGLLFLFRDGGFGRGSRFLDAREKLPFLLLFLGIGLTGLGSAYYHLNPANESLLWDRLPMAITFMSLFVAVLGERTRPEVGLVVLGPCLLLGVGSVLLWYIGELHGAGNLQPYHAVQFYPILVIPLLLLAPARYSRGGDYLIVLGFYALAKGLEVFDPRLFALLGGVGGHPLKHLVAGLGIYWLLRMLKLRRPILARTESL